MAKIVTKRAYDTIPPPAGLDSIWAMLPPLNAFPVSPSVTSTTRFIWLSAKARGWARHSGLVKFWGLERCPRRHCQIVYRGDWRG